MNDSKKELLVERSMEEKERSRVLFGFLGVLTTALSYFSVPSTFPVLKLAVKELTAHSSPMYSSITPVDVVFAAYMGGVIPAMAVYAWWSCITGKSISLAVGAEQGEQPNFPQAPRRHFWPRDANNL